MVASMPAEPSSESDSELGARLLQNLNRDSSAVRAFSGPPLLESKVSLALGGQEDALVALLTPCLASAVQEAAPDHVLANSQRIPWIHTSTEQRAFFLKPDLFACHLAAFLKGKAAPNSTNQSNSDAEAGHVLFGECAWPLRSAVMCLFEAKLRIHLDRDVGEAFRKVEHLLRDSPCASAKLCLFDVESLHMFECTSTGLLSHRSCEWTDAGSRAALVDFLRPLSQPVWLRVLLEVCRREGVTLPPADAFLGGGATGFAFRVHSATDNAGASVVRALKISAEAHHSDSIALEVFRMKELRRHSVAEPLAGVVPEAPGQAHLVDDGETRLGCGFVFGPVGTAVHLEARTSKLWLEVLEALLVLHRAGVEHGDPRLPNLLRVPDREQLVWIDFRTVMAKQEVRFVDDFRRCVAFFFKLGRNPARSQAVAWLEDKYVALVKARKTTPDVTSRFGEKVWTALKPPSSRRAQPDSESSPLSSPTSPLT